MSRNGSGTYTLPAGNPVVTNTVISSTWANTTLIDLANAMTGSVAADGQTPMTGPLNLNSNKIANVTDPTSDQDAATKYYVDNFIQDSANVTYNEGATGATTRTVKSKLQESVSVLDFGADPTGVADSTTAIQNAVNTAHRVFFPEGTYKTGSIAIPSNTALIGETVGGVIITANGTITESGLFETTSTTKVEIANFTFSAMFSSYATLSAIFVNSSSFCHVHDVYINAANYGVNFVNATDSIIERVTVINANQIGITVSGASNARNKVLTCTVNTTTVSHAIQINQGSYCEVSNCYCSNAKIFGISLFITEFTIATNNTTVNTEREGINLEGANTCTVSNNDLTWSNTSTSLDFGLSLFGKDRKSVV